MQTRRSQPAITIRSQKAVDRLKLLTSDGRSQTAVIEEALDRLPEPEATSADRKDDFMREIREIQARIAAKPFKYASMAEFDAAEYDEHGNCR